MVEVRRCRSIGCRWAESVSIGTDGTAPYEILWATPPSDGDHTLVARSLDHVGLSALSSEMIIHYDGALRSAAEGEGAARSSVASTNLADESTVSGWGILTAEIAGTADSGIAEVAFHARSETGDAWTTPGTDASAPYDQRVDREVLPAGDFQLRAVAAMAPGDGGSPESIAIGVTAQGPVPTVDSNRSRGGESARSAPTTSSAETPPAVDDRDKDGTSADRAVDLPDRKECDDERRPRGGAIDDDGIGKP